MGAQKYWLGLKQIVAIFCLAMAVVCLGASTAVGADYYVDISTGMDDDAHGSEAAPWKTLHYAFGVVPAGTPTIPTILHVAAGTYKVASGEETDTPLTIVSTTTDVHIKGEGWPEIICGDAVNWLTGIQIDAEGITVEGLKINGFLIGISSQYVNSTIQRNIIYSISDIGIELLCSAIPVSPLVVNNLLYNVGGVEGAGISIESNGSTGIPEIYHNTINGVPSGTGIYIYESMTSAPLIAPKISFNIITNHSSTGGEGIYNFGGAPVISYNNFYGNTVDIIGCSSGCAVSNNLIESDPSYINEVSGDFHLNSDSPCIDQVPSSVVCGDLDHPDSSPCWRPQGIAKDMGCYEELKTYTVTFATDGTAGATLTGTVSQTVTHGSSCTPVTAVAPTGYEFVKWTLGDADYSVNNPLTVTNVTSDMALTAVFAVATYTVTFATDGTAGATLSGTLSQTLIHGSSCTAVRAVAPTGYEFVKWTLGDADYSVNNPLTVTNVTSDMALKAVFAVITYKVTFVTDGTPGATLSGTMSQTVTHGSSCTAVRAVAPTDYIFVKWTLGDADYSVNNPLTVTNVTSDMTLMAVFASNAFMVTFVTDGTPGARLSGTLSQTVARGGTCTPVSAVAPTGYTFIKWTIAGETYSTNRSVTVVNVTSDMVLTAVFSAFSVDTYTVTFITDGAAGAVLNGRLSQTVVSGRSCSAVEAVAPAGYVFVGWATLSGDVVSTNNPLTVTNVTYSMTRMAVFAVKAYAVDFVTDGTAGATLTGAINQAVAPEGTGTPVEAVAPAEYVFVKWTWNGSDYSTANPLTVANVTSNMTLTAVFALKTYNTVAFVTDGTTGASLEGILSQAVAPGGSCTAVEAVTPAGHVFVKWTWNGSDYSTVNPLTVANVTSNMTLTAVFVLKTYNTVTFVTDGTTGASLEGILSQAVALGGSCTAVEAVAPAGYKFVKWTLAGEDYSVVNPLTVTNVTSDMVLTGVFVEIAVDTYTVTFVTDGTAGAALSGAANQTMAHGGICTPVKAVPPPGYGFLKWTLEGTGYSLSNPLTVGNVTSDMTITAVFIENTGNLPPEKPVLIEPVGNAVVPPGPFTLQSGPYVDPEDDPHAGTWWQVSRFGIPGVVYSETSMTDLDAHEIFQGLDAGLKYAWRAGYQDMGSGDYTWSDSEAFIVGQVTVDENMPPVAPGVDMAAYRMVSFIQWPLDPSAWAVFSPLMGGEYDTAMFRIGNYDPTYGNGGYREYPNFTVEPGQPCWLLARDGLDLSFTGVPVSTSVDFCIGLKYNAASVNGWNMVAPPNDRDYRWGDLQVMVKDSAGNTILAPKPISQMEAENKFIDVRIFGWGAGAYTASTLPEFLLERYSGYWVRVKQPNVYLCFPADAGIAARSGRMMDSIWSRLTAWVGSIFPETDTAYANAPTDSPPMPMAGLNTEEKAGGSGGGGCFIDAIGDSGD